MIKKIGLVTWFGGSNYGTSLQAYALNYILERMGARSYLLKRHKTWRNLIGDLQRGIKTWFSDSSSYGLSIAKKKKIAQFKKDNFHQFSQCIGLIGSLWYKKQIASLSCVISGSDQLWNPYHTDSFLLLKDFNSKKYSYASSIGVENIPLEKRQLYKQSLSSFSRISVREKSAIRTLKQVYSGMITKVVDPTLLLSSQQWIDFSNNYTIDFDTDKPYILAYFIADNVSYWERINEIKQKTGIERVVILPMHPNHFQYDAQIVEDAGIYDFVYLVRFAALVCTDSFHATVMSINLSVNFVAFLRFKTDDKMSQNSRLIDLLDNYGLSHRLYENNQGNLLSAIDYSFAKTVLSKERAESISYLQFIIGDC